MKNKALLLALLSLPFLIPPAFAGNADAVLKGTAEDSPISGNIHFEETDSRLKMTAEVSGVPAGMHGFHIHENGSCADAGKAAGSHFNPDKAPHGLLSKDGFTGAHAGDLGNIEIAADGTGKLEAMLPGLSLSEGPHDVTGKSVILHEKEDDFGQPTGNAGGRIACGVIEKK